MKNESLIKSGKFYDAYDVFVNNLLLTKDIFAYLNKSDNVIISKVEGKNFISDADAWTHNNYNDHVLIAYKLGQKIRNEDNCYGYVKESKIIYPFIGDCREYEDFFDKNVFLVDDEYFDYKHPKLRLDIGERAINLNRIKDYLINNFMKDVLKVHGLNPKILKNAAEVVSLYEYKTSTSKKDILINLANSSEYKKLKNRVQNQHNKNMQR